MKKMLKFAKDARFLAGFAACALALLSGYLLVNTDKTPVEELDAYNQAVELLDGREYVDAIKQFGEVTVMPPERSTLDANSYYNMGYIVATQGNGSVDTLKLARSLYVEALRISPDDVDIRKSIEILNQAIVEQLMEEGQTAEEARKSLEPGDDNYPQPGDGEDDSPGGGSPDDY